MEKMFNIEDEWSFEIIYSIKVKLRCSLATTYRTLDKARLPVYYVPNHPSQVLIHCSTIWRLAATPAWQKYLKQKEYKLPKKRKLKRFLDQYGHSDIVELFAEGVFEHLTLAQVISAADNGLMPVDKYYNLPTWYIALVLGVVEVPLPRKR